VINDLPRMIKPIAVTGRGIAREGAKVFKGKKHVGYITSGTMVPFWIIEGEGLSSSQTDHHQLRSICLGYIDSDILEDEKLTIEIRGKAVDAVVVKHHMRSEAPPYARPIVFDQQLAENKLPAGDTQSRVSRLLEKTLENTLWRQKSCINLIPSEMTISPMARLLSVMDPAFRYAEHKKSIAFYDADIFYYQGTDFICEVEQMLEEEMRKFLGCDNIETRLISGQMANTAVFSAMIDFINRADRKSEPRRIRQVNPRTEKPAVVNFPVLADNQFKIDVPATLKLIDEYRPEFIIFGKSMVIHKEPVAEIRQFLNTQAIKSVVMYDMAHVLGLIGPHFQQPFAEGADIVTGSTHKTFFGTQRGVAGSNFQENEEFYGLWESLVRRTFPGSVSNHHLGTLLGLLMAAYEMNYFKDEYQPEVIANAKSFARALKDCGLDVAGDPAIDFTETHQVILHVGYGRGPEIARQLEVNNIICNYQASTDEEGFTASGALRMGVSEMTRFGMEEKDFQSLAGLIQEVIINNANVADRVEKLREKCSTLKFCFSESKYDDILQKLHGLL